jgi:DNA replication factor GINS
MRLYTLCAEVRQNMNRTELKDVLRSESSSSLKGLGSDFYESVAKYIRELEDEIRQINNPRSVESRMLEDELQSAITDVEVIFLRRIKKITTRATSNAFSKKSPNQDMDKLLPAEKKIYDSVLSAINSARGELLEPILNPEMVASAPKSVSSWESTSSAGLQEHDPRGMSDLSTSEVFERAGPGRTPEISKENIPDVIGKSNINEEFVVVRILKDLPTFKALDNRNYALSAEDVVVLPTLNAQGLVKRNVAHIITKL